MPTKYASDLIGDRGDAVKLELGGDEVVVATSWTVTESVLSQPSAWAIRTGHGGVAAKLLKKYPPRTPFKLYVGDNLQASGTTDARGAASSPGGATEVTFHGRDALAQIHDSFVDHVQTFNDVATYKDLVLRVFKILGIRKQLRTDNAANRKTKVGVTITELPHRTVDELLSLKALPGGSVTIGSVQRHFQAKLNESWHHFLRRHLDRAGLFLWAAADGSFVLAQPQGQQEPTYRLVRIGGENAKHRANVVAVSFSDDATHRHSEIHIYGRSGGKKHGRAKEKGSFHDGEMVDWGYDQPIVYRDVDCQSESEAVFFARRKIAEERREGWRLEYTLSGHTLPAAQVPGKRAVLVPDTVVDVDDQELGIKEKLYVESVTKQRSKGTTTQIRLMRPSDLLFGGGGESEGGG